METKRAQFTSKPWYHVGTLGWKDRNDLSRKVGLYSVNPERLVRTVSVRGNSENVGGIKGTSGPDGETSKSGVSRLDVGEFICKERLAARGVASSGFTEDGLPIAVGLQELDKGLEDLDVVGGAVRVSATIIAVQVLVNIKDQLAGAAERIRNLNEEGASLGGERLCRRPAAAWKKEVVRSSGGADSVDSSLHGVDPGRDRRNIVRLVHDAENDALVAAILLSELSPDALELGVGGTTLSNDAPVPARVVVQVDDDEDVGTGVQGGLDGLVIARQETLADGTAEGRSHELPGERNTIQVRALRREVGELRDWRGDTGACEATICSNAEVIASRVHTSKTRKSTSGGSWSGRRA